MPTVREIKLDLDVAAAKRLRAGQFISFPEAPGLRLQGAASGCRWVYRYRSPADNSIRQVKLGGWPALPAHKALVAWEGKRDERNAGRDPAVERREEAQRIRNKPKPRTVAAIVAAYVEALGKLDPRKKAPRRTAKGLKEIERMFDIDLGPIGKLDAVDVHPRTAARFLRDVRDRAPNIALRLKRELAAAWRTAKANGHLPPDASNPWPEALAGELAQGERDRVLNVGEVRSVMRFLPNYGPMVADALELSLRTGLRTGEVVALRYEWFELVDGVLWCNLPPSAMKGRRAHRVPFVGRARTIAEARFVGDFLFPSPKAGQHIGQKALGVAIFLHRESSVTRPELERARCPVNDWSAHDLRRTAATLLGDLGCPFEVIEAILAHRLPGVAKVYQRAEHAEAKVEWLGKLNTHIDAIAASESLRQIPRRKAAA